MAVTPSSMLDLGTRAPSFALPDTDGKTVSLSDFDGSPALLVMFLCNHCPYVKHVQAELARLGAEQAARGVAVFAIISNDFTKYHDYAAYKIKL
jgi:peroxiredoxin